jgi:endonuclease V-like protein UPF0215 family
LSCRSLRVIKPEIRVLGIDDGQFVFQSKGCALVVGVVFRGGCWLDGVMSTQITVDGFDATEKIGNMIRNSPHYGQLSVIMLNGLTFAGFNVVDIKELSKKSSLPVIVVTNRKPNFIKIHSALKKLPKSEERWNSILNAGEIFPVVTRPKLLPVYVEVAGVSKETAAEVLMLTATRSKIPEALRVAHLMASGISLYST